MEVVKAILVEAKKMRLLDGLRSEVAEVRTWLPSSHYSPIFTDFFGLSWETSTLNNYHPEDSKHSGSGRIESSSKSTTFLM